jgi:hypothetical protein
MNITWGELVLRDREVAVQGLQILLDEAVSRPDEPGLSDWRGSFRLNAEQRRLVGDLVGEAKAKIILADRRSGPVVIKDYDAISGEASFSGAGELKR